MILIIVNVASGRCPLQEFVGFLLLIRSFLFAMRPSWAALMDSAGSVWRVLGHFD